LTAATSWSAAALSAGLLSARIMRARYSASADALSSGVIASVRSLVLVGVVVGVDELPEFGEVVLLDF
jgi:hypothetical protein